MINTKTRRVYDEGIGVWGGRGTEYRPGGNAQGFKTDWKWAGTPDYRGYDHRGADGNGGFSSFSAQSPKDPFNYNVHQHFHYGDTIENTRVRVGAASSTGRRRETTMMDVKRGVVERMHERKRMRGYEEIESDTCILL